MAEAPDTDLRTDEGSANGNTTSSGEVDPGEPGNEEVDAPGELGVDPPEVRPPGTVGHDPVTPEALVEFMSAQWAATDSPVTAPAARAAYSARRRAAVSELFPGAWMVVPAGGLKVRANDTDYPFRPSTDFWWLTGCDEPEALLVLTPSDLGEAGETSADGDSGPAQPGHTATLFAPPRSDRSTPAFFTDRRYGELWVGRRLGLDELSHLLDIDTAPLDELEATLKAAEGETVRVIRGFDARVDSLVAPPPEPEVEVDEDGNEHTPPDADGELAQALSELRLLKDDHEIACLQRAVDATVAGFEDVVRALPTATRHSERWIEGTFNRRARTEGNDVGYGTIAACGQHACTLHWVRNDGPVRPGDLLLLDAGVEGIELYTADVTRTVPVSGRFSADQRDVYDAVWRAQRAGLKECRAGEPFLAPHRAAMRVLTEWLVERSILTDVEDALDEEHQYHRRYTLHGTSHMLGLDVHDCANARSEVYKHGDLAAGVVLTVEPGLYFQPDDLTVPERYRGIGVRIEDDVLVTESSPRVLSAALPTQADDVEAWMAPLMAAPSNER